MANWSSLFYQDKKNKLQWFDQLLVDEYQNLDLVLPTLKVKFSYSPGTVVVFSGRLLVHGVPEAVLWLTPVMCSPFFFFDACILVPLKGKVSFLVLTFNPCSHPLVLTPWSPCPLSLFPILVPCTSSLSLFLVFAFTARNSDTPVAISKD